MAVIGLVVHQEKDLAAKVAGELVDWLVANGHQIRLPPNDSPAGNHGEVIDTNGDDFSEDLDVAVCIGGDGSILRTVDLLLRPNAATPAPDLGSSLSPTVPIVGINVGQMGYLTEVDPDQAIDALSRFLSGHFRLESRMLLSATITGQDNVSLLALNEVVLEKTPSGHTVRLSLFVDGDFFTTYAADGIIVATPTGSTAYSLSARGPIVSPTHRCMLVTPVSPHMLFDRSLIWNLRTGSPYESKDNVERLCLQMVGMWLLSSPAKKWCAQRRLPPLSS